MSQLTDELVETQGEEANVAEAIKVTAHYGADLQVEVWFEGPHSAAGWVLDLLLGHSSAEVELTSLTVVPKAQDVPNLPESQG